jgi:hypothetical protein
MPGEGAEAIVGGQVEPEGSDVARRTVLFTPAAGDGTHGCTATILDDAHALTAAHCLIGADEVDTVLVFATRFSPQATTRAVTAMRPFDTGFEHDIAVLGFSGGVPDGYVPVKLADDRVLAPGTPLIEAGYGKTAADSDGSERGILRSVVTALGRVDSSRRTLELSSVGHTVCNGDSGGPDYVSIDGALAQVGVHVSGDCASGSTSTDVRAYLAWIRAQLR